jgi:tRNA(Phe) wybutosine-synthesizing methylase Tyw3
VGGPQNGFVSSSASGFQVELSQQNRVQLDRLEQAFQQLVETLQGFETRLNRLEQTVQELVETRKPTGASPEEQDNTA